MLLFLPLLLIVICRKDLESYIVTLREGFGVDFFKKLFLGPRCYGKRGGIMWKLIVSANFGEHGQGYFKQKNKHFLSYTIDLCFYNS